MTNEENRTLNRVYWPPNRTNTWYTVLTPRNYNVSGAEKKTNVHKDDFCRKKSRMSPYLFTESQDIEKHETPKRVGQCNWYCTFPRTSLPCTGSFRLIDPPGLWEVVLSVTRTFVWNSTHRLFLGWRGPVASGGRRPGRKSPVGVDLTIYPENRTHDTGRSTSVHVPSTRPGLSDRLERTG